MTLVWSQYRVWATYLLSSLVPLFVIVSVLFPTWRHYYVPRVEIQAQTIERLRQVPDPSLLEQLAHMSLLRLPVDDNDQLIAAAEALLENEPLLLKGFPEMRVSLPLHHADLEKGLPSWQLHLAGLTIPAMLLEAYRLTEDEKYFDAARDSILAWARYERGALWPKGFVWNDHAVAARALVLARFWHVYRQHTRFDLSDAEVILEFVERTGRFLADPRHFTFATNHGVMQNLALLHIALAFPDLPRALHFKDAAMGRLDRQMEYYVNDEGVVLEHSAGYHRFGLELLGMALWYASRLGEKVPKSWQLKYEGAKRFYAQLRRPDGSLPLFGNTGVLSDLGGPGPDVARLEEGRVVEWGPAEWRPQPRSLHLVAGYAVWWHGLAGWPNVDRLAQTVVAWSRFPGHGHKLADELSVLYWAGGWDWWTNIGYWPYGAGDRAEAMSWRGSNAPHFLGEPGRSERQVRVHYAGRSNDLSVVDLERTASDGYRVRRQVIGLAEGATAVLDVAHDGRGRRTKVVWRTRPEVRVEPEASAGAFKLSAPSASSVLRAYFAGGDESFSARVTRGGDIEGRIALEQRPTPTSAVVVEFPSNGSWAAAVWAPEEGKGGAVRGESVVQQWHGPERWALRLPTNSGTVQILREGREIRAVRVARSNSILMLRAPEDSKAQRDRIRQALETTARSYPTHRDLREYRVKVASALSGLFVLQVLFLVGAARYVRRLPVPALSLLASIGWVSFCLWLHWLYFVV